MAAKKRKKEEMSAEEKSSAQADHVEPVSEPEPGEENEAELADSEDLPGPDDIIRQLEKENEELLDRLKRKQADIDNLRRIAKMEQAEARDYALYEFLCRLLPVLDNLERALESAREAKDVPETFVQGLEMIHKQLLQLLEQENVSIIEAVGEPFDPHCHHAVMQVENKEESPGIVLEELQKGYKHRKRILRPSMVKVCRE